MQKKLRNRNHGRETRLVSVDPNELKAKIRDGLVAMDAATREVFIQTLEAEMKRLKLDMRSYLIPLGIPARSPQELTPTEVGHLVRYWRYNVPQAMPAVERTLARCSLDLNEGVSPGDRLAA
ncbi:MAG TPA: hypothetical protein VJH03_19655 [Blastocatellia bacterium]|nr:hypothetical protein [Blastocatellia bacterium]